MDRFNVEVVYPRVIRWRRWVAALILMLFIGTRGLGGSAHPADSPSFVYQRVDHSALPTHVSEKDVLFAARTAWSESNRPNERRLVLWSIRNRVDNRFGGDSTYVDAVLSPWQYSCWAAPECRDRLKRLTLETPDVDWQETIDMTITVLASPPETNPIPGVMHFYSPVSMNPPGAVPHWAQGVTPVLIVPGEGLARFHFYKTAS